MASLKHRFEEIIHLNWEEFIDLEKSGEANVDDVVLCSLVRACAETDEISAIKLAFDRIDGLQETPVEVKVPKFYTRFVNAERIESTTKQLEAPESSENTKKTKYDPATAKLRETLREMRDMPRDVIKAVLVYKKRVEEGKTPAHVPHVKSVICANLLKNVLKGRFKAVELVFDQIDGKLTKTITLLGGEDVYLDDYITKVAPAGSLKDEAGVYYAENRIMTNQWLRGFAQSGKGLEILAEGLEDD